MQQRLATSTCARFKASLSRPRGLVVAAAAATPAGIVLARGRHVHDQPAESRGQQQEVVGKLISARLYTTDFGELSGMFDDSQFTPQQRAELEAVAVELRNDMNRRHFQRDQERFVQAAGALEEPLRSVFISFLERALMGEFSGFLLFKEIGRRLKAVSPTVAECFAMLSRDEARHAGFINKHLGDFDLSIDLGDLGNRGTFTFFKPKYILYATFLSEKIGAWRFNAIARHLMDHPEHRFSPLFSYFIRWSHDELRHGDFIAALLRVHQRSLLASPMAGLWSYGFCLLVTVTMFLNDHSRAAMFEEGLGVDVAAFDEHVIRATIADAARLFPRVPDVESPRFWELLQAMARIHERTRALDEPGSDVPALAHPLVRLALLERMASCALRLAAIPPVKAGSVDFACEASREACMY